MSTAAIQSLNLEMSSGEKTLHPFFTRGAVVAKRDDLTSCQESTTVPIEDQQVDAENRRQSKRQRPAEKVTGLETYAQRNQREANGNLMSQPVSQTKRRKVSKQARVKESGRETGCQSDPGLETLSGQAGAADMPSQIKASSDAGAREIGSSASKRKRRTKSTTAKGAQNTNDDQPCVLIDITGLDRKSYLSEDGQSSMQEVKSPKSGTCLSQLDSTDMRGSASTDEDRSLVDADGRPSADSSTDSEARGHETVMNSRDMQTSDGDHTRGSQYAPIFLPRRKSPGSDTSATKPSSVPRSKKRRSGQESVAQVDTSRTSSEGKILPRGRTLIVTLRYRHGSRAVSDGPQEKEEKITTRDVVDLTLDKCESSPLSATTTRATKPLHPFFLGKPTKQPNPAANKGLNQLNADASPSDDKTLTSGSDTDRGIRDSSRRPDSTNRPLAFGFAAGFGGANLGAGIRKSMVKFPGAVEAPWPAKDMVHIRGLETSHAHRHETNPEPLAAATVRPYQQKGQRKQKRAALQITENEDILHHLARRLDQILHTDATAPAGAETDGAKPKSSSSLRLPDRIVLTGSALKVLLRHELRSPIYAIDRDAIEVSGDDSRGFKSYAMERHPALLKLYRSIGKSFTPFDLFSCETQQWSTKYAPSSAEEVLQPGREAVVLRNWLRNVALSSADTARSKSRRARVPSTSEKQQSAAQKHKRRRVRKSREDELCDFIVPSEEESDGMEELSGPEEELDYPAIPRSVIRGGAETFSETRKENTRATNAVLISGPSGCGKTAAAYAVAKELDFEVFEINPGSRRNGKDLLEKIGDVTRNHLVHHSKDSISGNNPLEASSLPHAAGSARDSNNGKVSSIGSFFRPHAVSKPEPEGAPKSGTSTDTLSKYQTPRAQKQSLILLEEVDVLFEEDKAFWSTVLGLLSQSKRPIIMTCNDENIIPVDALPLHSILRFRPPPMDLAVDYLLLLAGAEGHLLRRPAVEALYRSKRRDLRASIMEIDFWCQMGVGDRKGGLEWMHPRCPSWEDNLADMDALHVASKDTYLTGIGWSCRDVIMEESGDPYAIEQELLHEAWNEWDMDVEDWCSCSDIKSWVDKFTSSAEGSSSKMFPACCAFSQFYDSLSSADVFSGHALAADVKIRLDTTQPAIPDHVRVDTVQGRTLIQGEPLVEYDGLSTDMALYIKAVTKRLLLTVMDEHGGETQTHPVSFKEGNLIELVTSRAQHEASSHQVTRRDLSAAFDPISEAPGPAPATPGFLQSSEFDRTSSLIVEDLAPYVRAIVLHDRQLEDQRREIREQSTKRLRTSRASRSALEGGNRSKMRRDKWFEGELDPDMVLKTGSREWYQAAAKLGSD